MRFQRSVAGEDIAAWRSGMTGWGRRTGRSVSAAIPPLPFAPCVERPLWQHAPPRHSSPFAVTAARRSPLAARRLPYPPSPHRSSSLLAISHRHPFSPLPPRRRRLYMLDCVTKGAASSPSPPPRPYLPVPACVCPRVPTPTSLPMPSCARCYHGQVEPAGGPGARCVGPAPAQQLPKQPSHGVCCAPHAQIVAACAIPAAIPAAIHAALPAATLRAAPPRAATLRAAALRAAALRAAALRAAAILAAQPSEQQPSEQCQPASPAVEEVYSAYRYHTQYHTTRRHHKPQLATLTILTTLAALATLTVLRTHHSRTHCVPAILATCFPFSSFSNSRHFHHSPQVVGKMAQLMLWDCEKLTPDAAALYAQQLVKLMGELAGHPDDMRLRYDSYHHHSMLV